MLVEFSVGNYQAFGAPQSVPIKPITLIFGPNGVGKSALLKSLLVSRHAVLEGKLQKSQGAWDRHPGTFKSMQRNEPVPIPDAEDDEILFGWTLMHADKNAKRAEKLGLQWHEFTANGFCTRRLVFYRNKKLFIDGHDYGSSKLGLSLNGKLHAAVEQVISDSSINAEGHSGLLKKIKETLLGNLKVLDEVLFPGSDDELHAFYFGEALTEELEAALSSDIPNSRRRANLIKRIEEAASRLLLMILVPLSEFHKSLASELKSLVYHGPIRPVYDEIKATDTSDSQMGEWLKLAEDSDLCEKVNNWLACTTPNNKMKVVVSRVTTMYELTAVLNNYLKEFRQDEILIEAYRVCLTDRMKKYVREADRAIKIYKRQSEEQDGEPPMIPYGLEKDGEQWFYTGAEMTEWMQFDRLTPEEQSFSAQTFYGQLTSSGDCKGIEDFLLRGVYSLFSKKVAGLSTLGDPDQASDLHKVLFVDSRTNKAVQASNLGLGYSQMLPLVISAYACEDQLIAIEQPELHVHPTLQTELADLFIQSAMERKNRFLIETHSEHLILRVMRRIRETTRNSLPEGKHPIKPEDVAILYVQPGENGSTVKELRIDEQGRFLDNWPHGFFEERLDEMF